MYICVIIPAYLYIIRRISPDGNNLYNMALANMINAFKICTFEEDNRD